MGAPSAQPTPSAAPGAVSGGPWPSRLWSEPRIPPARRTPPGSGSRAVPDDFTRPHTVHRLWSAALNALPERIDRRSRLAARARRLGRAHGRRLQEGCSAGAAGGARRSCPRRSRPPTASDRRGRGLATVPSRWRWLSRPPRTEGPTPPSWSRSTGLPAAGEWTWRRPWRPGIKT